MIKVQPPLGDWGLPIWMDGSWGKKNILLDIGGRRGKARLHELLASADVLIDGQRPGVLNGMGLAEREEKGGYYHVASSLARCSTLAPALATLLDAEPYKPVRMQDLVAYAVDQASPAGIFTRIAPVVEFSHTPSHAHRHPTLMNSMPDTTGWDDVPTNPPKVPHEPSKLAHEGKIDGLVECFGIEDRSDGGGIMSLASKSLIDYVLAHRNN